VATINDIGIPGVGSGILHPKHKNRWRVTFANLAGGVDSQPMSMQARRVKRPVLSFETIELHRYNSRAWIAGKHNWEPITMTIEDDVTSSASNVIQAQLQKQQFLIGAEGQFLAAAGEGSLYKFVTYLDMLDGNDQVIEKWTVEGCYIEQADFGEVDYTVNEAVTIELTVRYDHARQLLGGYSQGQGVATGGAGTTNG
jgi:hypothetical protein